MDREDRYLVVKHNDAALYLTATERLILVAIAEKIEACRISKGKSPMQCVVVEHDWPEYEPTWRAIEQRMDETPKL